MSARAARGGKPTMLLFAPPASATSIEQTVVGAQWAAARDTIESVLANELCDRVIVATGSPELVTQLDGLPVILEPDDADFHFGRQLRDLIRRHGVERALYFGAGSGVLLGDDGIRGLCCKLSASERAVIPNNLWSSDFVGFVPGNAMERFAPPATDNNLAFLLNREAGLPEVALPTSAATQFDIDTPTDLLILGLHPKLRGHLKQYVDDHEMEYSRLRAVMRRLVDATAEVVVAGRVGAATWTHIERETACRIRLFSEERGMRASGREDRGEARSLLGFVVERHGPRLLFEELARLGGAAIVDSRVVFAHLGLRPTAADRFNSDLLKSDLIVDPIVREFTIAARDAAIPVLLGGHSVVSGGLWALVDVAWKTSEQ